MEFLGTLFSNKLMLQLQVIKYHNRVEDVPSKPADPLIVLLSLIQRMKSIQAIIGIRLKRKSCCFQDAIDAIDRCCFHVNFQISIFSIDFWGLLHWKVKNLSHASSLPGSTWPAAQLVRSHSSQWPEISAEGFFASKLPPPSTLSTLSTLWTMLELYCILHTVYN